MRHRDDIQGLRAIAVLLVIFAHVGIFGFAGGWIGVDVFFVISGYLITSLLLREYAKTNDVSLLQFYLRRAKRILPAALITILVVVIASGLLLNSIRTENVHSDALWAVGFVSNIHFININTDYFTSTQAVSPLQHFWSLAVEEQFYLIWPALFLLVARQRGLRIQRRKIRLNGRVLLAAFVLAELSLLWSISFTRSDPTSAYFSTLTRVWELGFGVMLAASARPILKWSRRFSTAKLNSTLDALSWAGSAAILLGACVLIKPGDPFPGAIALIPVLGAIGILFGGLTDHQPIPNRILASGPLPFIGAISFSLYLWHWPVHVFADALYPDSVNSVLGISAQLVVILAISLVSYYLIENPARHLRIGQKELTRKRSDEVTKLPVAAISIMCVGAALLFVVSVGSSDSKETDAQIIAESASPTIPSSATTTIARTPATPAEMDAAIADWKSKVRDGLEAELTPQLRDQITTEAKRNIWESCAVATVGCTDGDPIGTRTVALFGDSHSGMIAGMVADALPGWKVHLLTNSGCPTAFYDRDAKQNAENVAQCQRDRQKFIDSILADPPDLLIMSDALGFVNSRSSGEWSAGQATTYDLLEPLDGRVPIVHLSPTPTHTNWDRCLGNSNSLARCNSTTDTIQFALDAQTAVIADHPWITQLDITPLLCTDGACPAVIDGMPVTLDGSHFSVVFRHALAPTFADLLARRIPSLAPQLATG
jgi:peptidoglycan/LPS O-acetylase OafA/YrhL